MLCPNCLTNNPEDAFVCSKCGRNFQTGEISKDKVEPVRGAFIIPVATTGLSIIAGYLGIFSLITILYVYIGSYFILSFFPPLSFVVSFLALQQLKKKPGKLGKGRAIFGLVVGILGTLIVLYLYIFPRS